MAKRCVKFVFVLDPAGAAHDAPRPPRYPSLFSSPRRLYPLNRCHWTGDPIFPNAGSYET